MFIHPFVLPSAPEKHPIHSLKTLLTACPTFSYLFAPISTPLFASWCAQIFDDTLGKGKWLRLSALEHPQESSIYAAIADLVAPESAGTSLSKPSSWLALTRALEALPPADEEKQYVVLIERAERLTQTAVTMLSRLGEETDGRIAIVLLASAPWDMVRPFGALDPYHLYLPPLDAPESEAFLQSIFPRLPQTTEISDYHPFLEYIFRRYASQVQVALCPSYTSCPLVLAQLALARWPFFIGPVLKEWRIQREGSAREKSEVGDEEEYDEEEHLPFTVAGDDLGQLITRGLSREWHRSVIVGAYSPHDDILDDEDIPALLSKPEWIRFRLNDNPFLRPTRSTITRALSSLSAGSDAPLGTLHKWVLIASHLASTNHQRTDVRLFARFSESRGRPRRRRGSATKPMGRKGAMGESKEKVPQYLLGPGTFPLDRMMAILSALVREHAPLWASKDVDGTLSRVGVYTTIAELVEKRLLIRVSGQDKLDSVILRCGERSWERIRHFGKEVGVKTEEFLWDRTS